MEQTIKELQKQINEYKKYSELANQAEEKMTADPLNKEAEQEFDAMWSKEHKAFLASVRLLETLIKVDEDVARRMVSTRTDDVIEIINKLK